MPEEKVLWRIWRVPANWEAYPISAIAWGLWDRGNVVSMDREKVEENCRYLNSICDENERYEVRSSLREEADRLLT